MALGLGAGTAGIAIAIGAIVGGLLLEHFSWSSVFWINVPLGVGVAIATLRWVPTSDAHAVGRFDGVGMVRPIETEE